MRAELQWNELARPFQACSIMGLAAGAVYLWFLAPLLVESWFLNAPPPLRGLLLEAWITGILVGFMTVPLGGAIGLLTLPLSDEHRGIIALFVMIFSFIGILVLATYALEYLLPLWPFALAAMIWIPMVWMAIKAARNNREKGRRKQNRPSVVRLEIPVRRKSGFRAGRLLSMLVSSRSQPYGLYSGDAHG